MSKRKEGFTLIELLIVVAIIAILAAIAVPNFLEAQIRSKVSRAKSDLRTIAVAMECYFVDWNGYPRHADFTQGIPMERQYWWWSALTTPVAYMTSMPPDPFQGPRPLWAGPATSYYFGGTYHYDPWQNTWAGGIMGDTFGAWIGFVPEMRRRGLWWSIASLGPDGDYDIGRPREGDYRFPTDADRGAGMGAFYDPTNGTVSSGDVVRLGPGASDHIAF